jgi:hypothetical protein
MMKTIFSVGMNPPVEVPETVNDVSLPEFLSERIKDDYLTAERELIYGVDQPECRLYARVMDEALAKRAVLEKYNSIDYVCERDTALYEVLRVLAAIYSDHKDYKQEWAVA